MPAIHCEAKIAMPDPIAKVGSEPVVSIPESASGQLPSRGASLVNGTINGFPFQAVLEPDGKGSHWFRVTRDLREGARVEAGDTVELEFEPAKDWPEPSVPADLAAALAADSEANAVWLDITPMARWDWIRWVAACKTPETRAKHVVVACSKLKSGKRRACCFDRSMCTLTEDYYS